MHCATYARSIAVVFAAIALTRCGSHGDTAALSTSTPSTRASTAQSGAHGLQGADSPLPVEANPPGDIPDTQAFVRYSSPDAQFSIEVPEGWARAGSGRSLTFSDKFDGMAVSVSRDTDSLEAIRRRADAGRDFRSQRVMLPAGPAQEISYTSNSRSDPVTEKRLRLENIEIIVVNGSKALTLHVWAPQGADNVDQWNRIEQSLRLH